MLFVEAKWIRNNILASDNIKDYKVKGLTSVKKGTNIAEYINDDKLEEILTDAHPLVFGDTLVAYLKLIRTALLNHVHNGSGNIACDITPSIAVKDFSDKAEKLENAMLSKNIRIN